MACGDPAEEYRNVENLQDITFDIGCYHSSTPNTPRAPATRVYGTSWLNSQKSVQTYATSYHRLGSFTEIS
jgi:hypothetical protein